MKGTARTVFWKQRLLEYSALIAAYSVALGVVISPVRGIIAMYAGPVVLLLLAWVVAIEAIDRWTDG